MSCINCNENKCNCQCVTSTTTTCTENYPIPCIDVCSGDYFDTSCIIYDGPDFNCYGLKNGDSLKDILNLILEKLNLSDCSCDFGPSISQLITTTTSSTTSTTTLPPPPALCFNFVSEEVGQELTYSCSTVNKLINPGTIINGKYSYSFTYGAFDYIIKWSFVENRWELYNTSLNPDLFVAYLESTSSYPLGPLEPDSSILPSLTWVSSDSGPFLVVTRNNCPANICVEIETEQSTDTITFISFYNTLDTYPVGTTSTNPIYFSYCEVTQPPVYSIKFNSFTNVYELYEGLNKVAFASQTGFETTSYLNWVILPSYSSQYISIKSRICPLTL